MINVRKVISTHWGFILLVLYYFFLLNYGLLLPHINTLLRIYFLMIFWHFIFIMSCVFFYKYLAVTNLYKIFVVSIYPTMIMTILLQYVSMYNKYNVNMCLDFLININQFYYKNISLEFNNVNVMFSTVTIQIFIVSMIFSYYYNFNMIYSFRFFTLLNSFVFSMVFLLHGSSLFITFFFWEFIGIFSFTLISFNNNKPNTLKSSSKAVFFNKISDLLFLVSIASLYLMIGNFFIDINSLHILFIHTCFQRPSILGVELLDIFLVSLSIACFIKSAQIFLHFWLPDSMEAPLPASALIHSATLVAAGIYMFIKFRDVFFLSDFFSNSIIAISTITFFFGSLTASVQSDYKKILAYSTIANCGVMFFSIFIVDINIVIIYFAIHGFYKSITFLISGFLIAQINHNQDSRYSASNSKIFLSIISLIFITILYLSSWSFLYSSIIKHLSVSYNTPIIIFKLSLFLGTIFSYSYSIRLVFIFIEKFLKFYKKNIFDKNYRFFFTIYIYLMLIHIFSYFNFYKNEKIISNNNFNKNTTFFFLNILLYYFTLFKNFNFFFFKKKYLLLLMFIIFF